MIPQNWGLVSQKTYSFKNVQYTFRTHGVYEMKTASPRFQTWWYDCGSLSKKSQTIYPLCNIAEHFWRDCFLYLSVLSGQTCGAVLKEMVK